MGGQMTEITNTDLLEMSLEELRKEAQAADSKGNELMCESECWTVQDLMEVDRTLANRLTELWELIAEREK